MKDAWRRGIWVLPAIGLVSAALLAGEPPDSEVNPATGDIESVDTKLEGSFSQIRHVTDPGQGAPVVSILLTGATADNVGPRIAIRSSGSAGVTWWRDSGEDAVYMRSRDAATGLWSLKQRVSEPGEGSRHPEIVSDGSTFWIAFEYDTPGGDTGIGVSSIFDDPEPFPTRRPIDTTGYTGDVDVLIHAESNNVWVTWLHDGVDVAWSEYEATSDTWSLTSYESYAADDVASARQRIRTTVLNN